MVRKRGVRLIQRRVRSAGLALVLGAFALGCGDATPSQRQEAAAGAGGEASCLRSTDCGAGERCEVGECVKDGCRSEGQECSPNGRGVVTCPAAGQEEILTPCLEMERCVALEEGQAECRSTACEPGQWSCVEPEVAQRCREDGSGIEEERDCAELGQVCEEGECKPLACGPNCDPTSCEPGARRCSGEQVSECTADGAGYRPTGDDCSETGAACFDGSCWPRVCDGTYRCQGNTSVGCVDNGTREKREPCGDPEGSFCSPATGKCEPYVCLPATAVCQGTLATRCADDGSGPLEVGIECSATGETCWDGGCAPLVCSAGYRCVGNELSLCGKAGSAWVPAMTCEPGTECHASAGTCTPVTCVPEAPVCRGGVATTCESSGVGYVAGGVDCVAQGKTCLFGACATPVCAANKAFCSGKELLQCDAIGASSTLVETCTASEVCDGEQGSCVPALCVPGSSLCNGSVLTTCNEEGTGPAPGGVDCSAAGKVCHLGECLQPICEPKLSFCGSGLVLLCNDSGTSAAPFIVCGAGQHCSGVVGAASCVADVGKDLL